VRELAQGVACWFTVYPSTGRGTYLPLAAMSRARRTCVMSTSESSSLSSREDSGDSPGKNIYRKCVFSTVEISQLFKLSSAKTCFKLEKIVKVALFATYF
jgi:hypothetical protein